MKVGIVGLGLIGGSFAKAYQKAGAEVYAFDIDESILKFAILSGAVKAKLTDDMLSECDLVLLCTYPAAAIEYMKSKGCYFGQKPVVMDCCGTKRNIVDEGRAIAKEHGFLYVGGHPMAGTQFSGFKYAREDLYVGAPMVIIPPVYDDIILLDHIKSLLTMVGFASITVTTAEKHDEMIAFTSQLAHVVSNAYIKSPTATHHEGLSAGSYRDMTRVAWLNPQMWTELFFDNKDYLLTEIDQIIGCLQEYRDALACDDHAQMERLLLDGKLRKEEVDG